MALTSEQKSSRLFKKLVGAGETLTTRDFFEEPKLGKSAILPSQIWSQADEIPVPAPTLSDGLTQGVVQYHHKLSLTHVPGSLGKSFYSTTLMDAIPFNYGDGTYNYSLYTSGDVAIAFGQGDWLVDTEAGLLTFYANTLPSGVDASNPPKISFYKYVGNKGLTIISGDVGNLSTALSSEVSSRISADSSLSTGISQRVSTDVVLSSGLSTGISQRVSTDVVLSSGLSTGLAQRVSTDAILSSDLSSEVSSRITLGTTIYERISIEESDRISGYTYLSLQDAVLSSDISSEVSSRIAEVNNLSSGLSSEVSSRTAADTSLSTDLSITTSIAKGAQQAIAYPDYQTMCNSLMSVGYEELNIGQSIYINILDVPDIWISDTPLSPTGYTFVSDEQLIADVEAGGGQLQIGYFTISFLETQKVYLTNYATTTALSSEVSSRTAADISLSTGISQRVSTDVVLSSGLSTGLAQRVSTDASLSTGISQRVSTDAVLSSGLSSEASSRITLGTTFYERISIEESDRISGYTYLYDRTMILSGKTEELTIDLSSETSQRVSTDASLSTGLSQRVSTDEYLKTSILEKMDLIWAGSYSETPPVGVGFPGQTVITPNFVYTWTGDEWYEDFPEYGIYITLTDHKTYFGDTGGQTIKEISYESVRLSADNSLSTALSSEASTRLSADVYEGSLRLDMAGSGLTYGVDNRLQVNVDNYTISVVNDELRTPETWMQFDSTTTIVDNVTNGSTNIVLDYNPVGYVSAYINGIEYMVSASTTSATGQPFYFIELPVANSVLYFNAVEAGFGLESGVDMIMIKYHYIDTTII